VRAEFINVFNRAKIGNPIPSNPPGARIQERTGVTAVSVSSTVCGGRANSERYAQLDRREAAEHTHWIAGFTFERVSGLPVRSWPLTKKK
jgi:hypothetical protein